MSFLVTPAALGQPATGLLASAYTPADPLERADVLGEFGSSRGYAVADYLSTTVVDHGFMGRAAGLEYQPFEVRAGEVVSAMSGMGEVELAARVRRVFDALESAAIARELWTGELAAAAAHAKPHPTLETDPGPNATTDLTGASAVKVGVGLALLENALADELLGAPGMVHCRPGVLELLPGVEAAGAQRRTRYGNLVVADAGYPGTSPAGTAPTGTETWLYATGPVTVRRGAIATETVRRREVNDLAASALRLASVSFDGPAFAIRVDLAL